jgi:hypothetical protein
MSDRASMIARLLALGVVMLVSSGSQFSCTTGDTSLLDRDDDLGSGDGATFSTTLVLRDSSGTAKSSFDEGELITLELTVRNRTDQPQTVNLATTQATDFFVFRDDEDELLWNAGHGTAAPAVVTPLNFAANETKVVSLAWNQEIPDGTFLPPGSYDARGAVMAVGVFAPAGDPLSPHELASNLREFTVD